MHKSKKRDKSQALDGVPVRTLGIQGVDFEILHWLEKRTKHSLYGRGNLSLVDMFSLYSLISVKFFPSGIRGGKKQG